MRLFSPTAIFRRVTNITPEYLHGHGIRALILDVDNTLTEHGSQELLPEVAAWLQRMHAEGIRLVIASNNMPKRVAPFARRVGLDYLAFCCKPSPLGLYRARRAIGVPRSAVALVGDQIFTDALGANLYGIPILLVQPMRQDTKPTIRLKRMLEKPILARYDKKGGLRYGWDAGQAQEICAPRGEPEPAPNAKAARPERRP